MGSVETQFPLDFSRSITPELYTDDPEYFSRFIPRTHKDAQVSEDASIQSQIDVFGKSNVGYVKGNLNPHAGGFMSLCMPYCLPERLALISYINEAGFIHDDVDFRFSYEPNTTASDITGKIGGMLPALSSDWESRNKQVISKMTVQLLNTDAHLGSLVIQQLTSWKRGEAVMEARDGQYQDLASYLTDRFVDVAWTFVLAITRFGCGFSLAEEQEKLIEPILKPLYDAVILTNDYFSWEKEHASFIQSQEKVVLKNAVHLFMEWYSLPVQEAKAAVKEKIKSLEDEYCSLKTDFFLYQTPTSSRSIMRWFDILEAVHAGNSLWSITCPRCRTASEHEYKQYMDRRLNEGAYFFEAPTESSAIIST